MQNNVRLRLFSNLIIVYMLLALAWWTFLLFTKNRDAFIAKVELQKLVMIANNEIQTSEAFLATPFYQNLLNDYQRNEWMIVGEAIAFAIILVIGIWMINRRYNQQVNAAQLSRNFLLSITHELKSPIASIQLVLETLKKRQLNEAQIKKLSHNALQDTNRLNTLVNDLLLAAKVETAYQPHIETISLSRLLPEIITKLQHRHPAANFEFRQSNENIQIAGDLTGITSVAMNLLENAVKYSHQTKPIIITNLREIGQKISIQFTDNGIGISNKEKNKVFKRFYRVGNEDTRQTKGTGLGLYIVDQIIKAHQGSITVSDNSPQGSIFTISLPKEQLEENIREVVKLNLELENYEVITADTGKMALKHFQEQHFDLILLDVMLPEVDGFQVCEQIRLTNMSIPIMMLTAKDAAMDRITGLKKGADDYLTKPFNLEEMLLRVQNLLRRSSKTPENTPEIYTFGENKVNFITFEAKGKNGNFNLTKKEAMLLKLLIDRKLIILFFLLENILKMLQNLQNTFYLFEVSVINLLDKIRC